VLAWIVALIGLYLMVHSSKPVAVGIFVLPVVVGLTAFAGWFSPRESGWRNWGDTIAFWGAVHGVFLLAGAVFTCLAFAAGLMYLAQLRRIKSKRPLRFGLTLPSLEQSERINRGAITVAFPLLTFGLLIGLILGIAARPAAGPVGSGPGPGSALSWTDPKVISALVMWGVFAVLLHARFRPAMRGRSMMFLTIVAFAFLVFTWVGVEALRLPTTHNMPRTAAAGRTLSP
jgi:ABC-type transport system involved in cytochrome c biogenesis permease subunit